MHVSTKTNDIALLKLIDLNGKEYSTSDLVQQFELSVHSSLDSINKKLMQKISFSHATEKFWVKEFLKSDFDTNFLSPSVRLGHSSCNSQKVTLIPKKLIKQIKRFTHESIDSKIFLLTIALIYFYRLNNYKKFIPSL